MGTESLTAQLTVGDRSYRYYPITAVEGAADLPYSLSVLVEDVLRTSKTEEEALTAAAAIIEAGLGGQAGEEIGFMPARVLLQDFTGVPVFVDFAAMRDAAVAMGGNPQLINPQIPCDLVIDHSVIAEQAGCAGCREANEAIERTRNKERYEFLKWAQEAFENVRIVPPGQGICHQLNIEQFATVVARAHDEAEDVESPLVYFDSLVGTDSHTPTANGLGVLGWGVGGIEAEAAALGQPITTLVPRVVGVRLDGTLAEGVTAMDVALTFASVLREAGVVGCFVECFGEGVKSLSATQRACIANMTPEYGCTCTLFPVDERTIDYLRLTGRSEEQLALVEAYAKAQGVWAAGEDAPRHYAEIITIDLGTVVPSMAGPSRPHNRFPRARAAEHFAEVCAERGRGDQTASVAIDGQAYELTDGAIAIAAVTSCTTATDPSMMIAAGLVARNAHRLGLKPAPWVKTIMAPGSHGVETILERAGLTESLDALGFQTCGFGCMSCIGNSGPLCAAMHNIASTIELTSVLSGNRNFDGRISPDVAQNYLTAPENVVAYALAGTMAIDLERDPLGVDTEGNPVFFAQIAADPVEVKQLVDTYVTPDVYASGAESLYAGDVAWQALGAEPSDLFAWDEDSTYVRKPSFFDAMTAPATESTLQDAVVLGLFGDFITTDHISPAGSIALDSPAACYLTAHGVAPEDFNSYGSRRGNHEVMMRGTFANGKLVNDLAEGKQGGWTCNELTGEQTTIFEAAEDYQAQGVPSIILAGKMYGSGSSRDWAAKGPNLLGVQAVIAESYERIHRSNLIGMGILPLQFKEGENAQILGLAGNERYSLALPQPEEGASLQQVLTVMAAKPDGTTVTFEAVVRIDTPTEGLYYAEGGILPYVLRQLLDHAS